MSEKEIAVQQVPRGADLDQRIRYAQHIAQSGLLPAAYRGRPANVLVAIETGNMLGIAPMAALHNIFVVDGKPTLSAALMGALVRRAGHKFRVWAEGEDKAIAELVRADDPGFTYRAVWTTQRAKDADLLRKDVWKKYRVNMLKNRAASEVCRDGAQDVFLGPVYVPEELGAAVDDQGNAVIDGETTDVVDQAGQRIDWEADLESLTGNYDGLRKLWLLAEQHGQPQEYLDRVKAAGEAAKPEQSPDADVQDADVQDAEIVDEDTTAPQGVNVDWDAAITEHARDHEELKTLWQAAKVAGVDQATLDAIERAGWKARLWDADGDPEKLTALDADAQRAGVDLEPLIDELEIEAVDDAEAGES